VAGAASITIAGLSTLLVTWWASLFDQVSDNQFSVFETLDIVAGGLRALHHARRCPRRGLRLAGATGDR
jgi:hypothetical protein